MARELSSTSYAILLLLDVREWTAYELAQQMSRSLSWVFPRAVSGVYEEPKRLVAHGLAAARSEPAGKRPRTVYSITAEGKRALRRWLREESAPPQLESEGALKALFADAGTKAGALAVLHELAAQAAAARDRLREQTEGYLADPGHGPFPRRLHLIALSARLFHEHWAALDRWARWAEAEVASWPSTRPRDTSFALDSIRALVAAERDGKFDRDLVTGEFL